MNKSEVVGNVKQVFFLGIWTQREASTCDCRWPWPRSHWKCWLLWWIKFSCKRWIRQESVPSVISFIILCCNVELKLSDVVLFMPAVKSDILKALLHSSRAVIYTPDNEHFGIVPLEAMSASVPVIAANSGGPKESIVHKKTGFVCWCSEFLSSNFLQDFSVSQLLSHLQVQCYPFFSIQPRLKRWMFWDLHFESMQWFTADGGSGLFESVNQFPSR